MSSGLGSSGGRIANLAPQGLADLVERANQAYRLKAPSALLVFSL